MQLSHDSLGLWEGRLQYAHFPSGSTKTLTWSSHNSGPKTAGRILTGLSPPAPGMPPARLSDWDHQANSLNYLLGRRSHQSSAFSPLNPAAACPHADSRLSCQSPAPEARGSWSHSCGSCMNVVGSSMWLVTTTMCALCLSSPMAPEHLVKGIIFQLSAGTWNSSQPPSRRTAAGSRPAQGPKRPWESLERGYFLSRHPMIK